MMKTLLAPAVCTLALLAGCQSLGGASSHPDGAHVSASAAQAALRETRRNESPFETLLALSRLTGVPVHAPSAKAHFDELVALARPGVEAARTPREKIQALNAVFFTQKKYQATADAVGVRVETILNPSSSGLLGVENLAPTKVMERKEGYCLSLAAVYGLVARELGLALHPVFVPNHVFLRFDDGNERINVELLKNGREISDADYAWGYRVAEAERTRGRYLASLREPLVFDAMFHRNLAVIASSMEKWSDVRRHLASYEATFPDDAFGHAMRGRMADVESKPRAARSAFTQAVERDPHHPWANAALAKLNLKDGQVDFARQRFEKAYDGGDVTAAAFAIVLAMHKPTAAADTIPVLSSVAAGQPWQLPNTERRYAVSRPGETTILLAAQPSTHKFDALVVARDEGNMREGAVRATPAPSFQEVSKSNLRAMLPEKGLRPWTHEACDFGYEASVSSAAVVICAKAFPFSDGAHLPGREGGGTIVYLTTTPERFAAHVPAFETFARQVKPFATR